ncbi:hypothetical protein [Pelotomaculum schinkii]|nr:hypothetical protein [Pelotomaculum schinkii]
MRRSDPLMPSVSVHEAKNKLTALRREAAIGKEFLLADAKRKDDQPVSLISTVLLDELCEAKTFSYEWLDEPGKESENYTLYNRETGVYGVGPTKAEAVEDFIDNIIDYSGVYFDDLPFYLSSSGGRREHYWYLRRVLRCEGDRERIYRVLDLDKVLLV